jgi:hypothetical protein
MSLASTIAGIVLVTVIIFIVISCKNKKAVNLRETKSQDSTTAIDHRTDTNVYPGLRNMAFSVTPEQLQLQLYPDKTIVFGVIMDWGINDATATIVSYQTGDASMYLSSGGAVIGGGRHPNVNTAAKQFVTLAQTFLDKAIKTDSYPLPETDEVKFYLLTNKGIFVGGEIMRNFENNTSAWLSLFNAGNVVMSELRITTEKK